MWTAGPRALRTKTVRPQSPAKLGGCLSKSFHRCDLVQMLAARALPRRV